MSAQKMNRRMAIKATATASAGALVISKEFLKQRSPPSRSGRTFRGWNP